MAGSRRQRGTLRVALLAGCVLFCVAAVGSGLDRETLQRPSKAERVPAFFASQAPLVRGQADLQTGRFDEALADGEAALRAAPVDPVSSSLLASARLGKGDAAGADRAFRVAGQMGWRVPLTQAYWMEQALNAGDYPVAAMRIDALLRQHPWMMEKPGLLAPFEDSAAGRTALAARLAGKSPWLATYAGAVEDLSPQRLMGRAAMLAELSRQGTAAGCDAVAQTINRLVEAGQLVQARQLWAGHCPLAKQAGLIDPAFEYLRSNGPRTYFDWDMVGSTGVGMAISGEGRTRSLLLHSEAGPNRQVLRQLVMLAPGRYRLNWKASTADGQATNRITASLGCNPLGSAPVITQAGSAEVTVGTDCPAHWLSFTLAPGEGEVRLSGISLEPLR